MVRKLEIKRIILVLIMAIAVVFVAGISSVHGATVTGTVTAKEGVYMRSTPDTSKNNIVMLLNYKTKVEILGEAQGSGYKWYNVKYNGKTGYAVTNYIAKNASGTTETTDFTYMYGKVNSDIGVNVRSGPGTGYSIIDGLPDKTEVKVNGKKKDSTGAIWYEIKCSAGKGYVFGEYLILKEVKPYEPNANFEQHLTNQGFPESYKVRLRQLHAQYPNWVFLAGKTNLDWNYVITKEYGGNGRRPNTIQNGQPDSWKSMEDGDYNFATGQYKSYDSGYYVAASRRLIAYYMDPRNFLNSTDIFQFISSKYVPSMQNSTGLQRMLNGTFMSGSFPESSYTTYNSILMDAAEKSGVSPYTLATMILQEQGRDGRGHSISGKEPGYAGIYNHFNIGAYASGGNSAVKNGLIYAKNQGWNTRAKSILGGANWFGRNYVYQNMYTQYLKKFNVMNGSSSVATGQYMTHVMGAYLEGANLQAAYKDFLNTSLTFEIPVYNNMPTAVSPMPTTTGDNNNFLDSITVAGKSVPSFNRLTYTYTVDAGKANTVSISAKANNSAAKIAGTGQKNLKAGTNTFKITVTATSGEQRVYTVNVKTTANAPVNFGFYSGTLQRTAGTTNGFLITTTDKSRTPKITSSNTSVAAITTINSKDSRGYYFEIKSKKAGTTTITAEIGGVKKSFTLKVVQPDFGFYSGTLQRTVGTTNAFLVTTKDKSSSMTLSSSNKSVAVINKINTKDSRGYYFEIKGKAIGTTTITAVLGGVKKSFTLKIIGPDYGFYSGTLQRTAGKTNGFLITTKNKSISPKITSSNTSVASITKINSKDSRGYYFEIKSKKAGTTTITADLGGRKKSFKLKVVQPDFGFYSGTLQRTVGTTNAFLVTTKDKSSGMKLSSSNKSVAVISKINTKDSRGYYFEIKGKAIGTTTITAERGGVKKSFTLKIVGPDFGFYSGTLQRTVGKTNGFLITTKNKNRSPKITSSNTSVASITMINSKDSRGYYFEIKSKKVGTTTITAEIGGRKKSFTLKVKK